LNHEFERIWKEAVVILFLNYIPGIRLEGLRNATKNFIKIAGLWAEI
jgi:hypothetical protein